MKGFEEGMIRIIQNITFKETQSQFQQDLKNDVASVKNENRLFVKADKTTNFYKLDLPDYKRLLEANITKTYKKADKKQISMMDEEAKIITKNLNIDDRVETTAMKEAFITLKDHKENFENKPTCRLINPSKPEIGRISKKLLEKINRNLVNITKVNQWKNTSSVLQRFHRLADKSDLAFMCFDVVEFYPSISEALLIRALDFASEHLNISASERRTIINSKHSLLFNKGQPWEKRNSTSNLDVTMGSYDLKITIEANKKVVNFLDVTLDLNTGKFRPYAKSLSTPLYVHSQSNHPPKILENIPEAINRRLCSISSDEDVFNEAAPPYQEALRKSGYTHKLEFRPPPQEPATQKRKRRRNVVWFNPPYNKNVRTNIGKEFISLINRSFPAGHKLRKIFNRNTVKLSYSCMPNVKQLIDGHNKAVLQSAQHSTAAARLREENMQL